MTELLYNKDATLFTFCATVRACCSEGDGYRILLDRTAFFPCEGGQGADRGTLGDVRVTDAILSGDEVIHITDAPLAVGDTVDGAVDVSRRRRHMQVHTGEHILSGVLHRMYGATNVGFHLGETEVTLDLDIPLDATQLRGAEDAANRAVFENRAVRILYPRPEELLALHYRAKLDLAEGVRLVEIDGVDLCACCAPHVERTGEVGLIRITSAMRYKGGTRLSIAVGCDALADHREKSESVHAVSVALSVPENEIAAAVQRTLSALSEEKRAVAELRAALREARLAAAVSASAGKDLFLAYPDLDPVGLRSYAEEGARMTDGLVLAVSPAEDGCRYALASCSGRARELSAALHAALGGRGGDRPQLTQGSVPAEAESVRAFLFSL